jgi:hypothetical protein
MPALLLDASGAAAVLDDVMPLIFGLILLFIILIVSVVTVFF